MPNGDTERTDSFSADPSRWIPILKDSFGRHLTDSLAQDQDTATQLGRYNSLALAVRDQLIRRWLKHPANIRQRGCQAGLLSVFGISPRTHAGQQSDQLAAPR